MTALTKRLLDSGFPLDNPLGASHICEDTDEDFVVCIEGEVYGFCEAEFCSGACDPEGKCRCPCHTEE